MNTRHKQVYTLGISPYYLARNSILLFFLIFMAALFSKNLNLFFLSTAALVLLVADFLLVFTSFVKLTDTTLRFNGLFRSRSIKLAQINKIDDANAPFVIGNPSAYVIYALQDTDIRPSYLIKEMYDRDELLSFIEILKSKLA